MAFATMRGIAHREELAAPRADLVARRRGPDRRNRPLEFRGAGYRPKLKAPSKADVRDELHRRRVIRIVPRGADDEVGREGDVRPLQPELF